MKFNISFILKGAGGTVLAPNATNPIEAKNIGEVLTRLAPHVPNSEQLGIECVGIEIKQIEEPKEYVLERGQLKEFYERDQSTINRSPTFAPPQVHTGQTQPPPGPLKRTPPMCSGHGNLGT